MHIEHSSDSPDVWTLVVDREPGVRRRPRVRVEAAMCRPWYANGPQVVRVIAGGATLLWGRRDVPWSDAPDFIRGTLPDKTAALPAVTLRDFEACPHSPPSSGWWQHWMRYFARALDETHDALLQRGTYSLTTPWQPLRVLVSEFESLPRVDAIGPVEFTRRPSVRHARRVQMWRKHAARGIPPALLYDWTCMPGPLLVDGHDRLLAMALEGVAQSALVVTPTAFGGRDRRITGNTSWGPTDERLRYRVGRLHPLPGGAATWRREVRDRLWTLRHENLWPRAEALLTGTDERV